MTCMNAPAKQRSGKTRHMLHLLAGELRESLAMAADAIGAHKLRSSLTLLGVMVGVFSIVMVMTAMRVMQRNIERELSQVGSRTFVVAKWPAVHFGGPKGFEKYWRRRNITWSQALDLQAQATLPAAIGMELNLWSGEVGSRFEQTPPTVKLLGETPGSFRAKNWDLDEGRALTESDVDGARDVCVLGAGLARSLFPFGSALGERVKINGIGYLVVGVLAPKGALEGGDQDNFAIIPLTTGLNRYGRAWQSLAILVQARSVELYEDTVEQVRGILRRVRKVPPGEEDDFEIFSSDSLINQFNSFTRLVRLGIGAVSSIAMLAAGIGIMNIMLVSVTERTREIGIRRATGAKKRHILTQFILEAVLLCQIGGLAGVVLGILGGNLVSYWLKAPPAVPLDWAGLALVMCLIVGVVFGTYPAVKAANLDPIESLRYE